MLYFVLLFSELIELERGYELATLPICANTLPMGCFRLWNWCETPSCIKQLWFLSANAFLGAAVSVFCARSPGSRACSDDCSQGCYWGRRHCGCSCCFDGYCCVYLGVIAVAVAPPNYIPSGTYPGGRNLGNQGLNTGYSTGYNTGYNTVLNARPIPNYNQQVYVAPNTVAV